MSLTGAVAGQTTGELDPAIVARLQQQIAIGSVEVKRSALAEIRNLRHASGSRLAVPALRDRQPIVRATAAASVVFLPKDEASSALLPLLNDRDEFVRREAAYALGVVGGDTTAVALLVRLMRTDKILEVRTAAAIALGQTGSVAALDGLVSVLKTRPREDNEFLRRSAARAIGQIAQFNSTGKTSVVTPQNFLPDKFKDLGAPSSPSDPSGLSPAFDVLIGVLRNRAESDDTRREAAFALGAIGDPRATEPLRAAISSPDPYLVEIAREALLKIERRHP